MRVAVLGECAAHDARAGLINVGAAAVVGPVGKDVAGAGARAGRVCVRAAADIRPIGEAVAGAAARAPGSLPGSVARQRVAGCGLVIGIVGAALDDDAAGPGICITAAVGAVAVVGRMAFP